MNHCHVTGAAQHGQSHIVRMTFGQPIDGRITHRKAFDLQPIPPRRKLRMRKSHDASAKRLDVLVNNAAYRCIKKASRIFFASGVDSSDINGEVLTLLGGETTAA